MRAILFLALVFAASLANAAITFTRTSSGTFYTDTSVTPNIACNYQSFAVQSSSSVADVWVSASNFTGSLTLGGSDDGIEHLGAFTAGQTRYAFFYVCSTSTASSSTGGFDLTAWDRSPSLAGAVSLGAATQSYTIDNTLIQAATNQVTVIFAGPNPSVIGGTITMTVEGDTGTIGNAPGPNGPFSFTPASYTNWRADAYELYASNISFSGGNSGSYDNQLYISGLPGGSNTHYVATYYFRALGGTTASTQLSPLVDIASGTQMKHTDTTKGAYGSALLPIEPASNSVLLSKLVSASTLPAQGGTVTYTLRVTNNSSYTIILLDDFQDTLPGGVTYVNGSSSFGGVAIANPNISGQVLTWNAPFSIAAGASMDLVFQATLPATPGLYTNSAVAHIGSTVIDTTYSTTDNVPATAATRVLAPPTVAKSFNPVATAVSSTSTLTLTITNPNATSGIAGVAIADTYPAGLVNAATPNAATTCTGATITGGAAGGGTIGITGGSLAAGASCTVTVTVTSGVAGTYSNTTGNVSSTTAGTGGTASASITFTTKPTITKSFSPAVAPLGTPSTVTLEVKNNNTVSLTGLAFSDTLPANMSVVASPAATNTCGGTLAGTFAGSGSVSLSGGVITLPATTCQVTFAVTASSAGVYANTTAGATSNETGAAGPASNTANLTVMSAPTVAKSFNVASVGRGQVATLTITLGNTNATDIAGAAFTDTYPANLVNASPASGSTTCSGGTVTATNGGGSVAVSGATIPANGSCTVTVNVTSGTAATYTNTIASGAVTATNAPASTAAASAQLIVNNTPTIAKSFSTNVGTGVTTMSLAITNNATTGGVSSLAFTDAFPSGLTVASTPALANTCGGTVSGATSGSGSISLSGGSIAAAGGTCTITVSVISNVQGIFDNTAGGVSSSLGTGAASNTATYIAAGLTKSFSPNTTGAGDVARLTITVFNPSASATLTGVTFSDTYPSGMTNTATPAVSNSCGGTVTGGAASGNTIGLSGGSVGPGATCAISVNVSANAVNSYYNQTGNVATNQGVGVNGADTLYITAKPTITKSFAPASITVGGTSTLTIQLENNNGANSISAVAFSDPFPSGLVVAATPALTNTCGGAVSGATSGSSTISLSGGALAANAKCAITVAVTSSTAASYSNQTNGATSTETGATPGPKSNIAILDVNLQAPTVAKGFATSPVGINTDTVMTITLQNPNAVAITGVNFTDTYPSGLVNSLTPNLTSTCGGVATAAAGANSVALVSGTIPASGSCTVSVSVQAGAPGSYVNNTGIVTSANANDGASASATLTVLAPLTVAKSFGTSPVGPNVATVMTVTLTNPNALAATGVAFTDSYPAGLANTATPAGATNCAAGTVTAAASGTSLAFSGGTVPANASCTVTVNVSAAAGGSYTNVLSAGAVTSTNAGANTVGGSATLNVNTALSATKAFSPTSVGTGDTSVMTITLTNPNAIAATGAAFTDTYPANLVNTASASGATTCTGGVVTAANNGSSLALSGATIPANGSCTVTVNVTSATAGTYVNSTGTITTANAGTATASGSLTVLAHPVVTKAFSPAQVAVNGPSTLLITLQNTNATAITGAGFTDTYPANLVNAATPAASSTCAGATITATAAGSSLVVSGATIPATSNCTVQVNVTPTATGALVNTLAAGAVTSANAGANTAPASGTLDSQAPLTVVKTFGPTAVGTNVPSVLTITLTNPNAVAVTGVVFSDTYPAGLANTATPNGATTCTAGTVTANAAGTSLVFSGGTVPASGSCTVTVNVAAASTGSYTNTLAAGAVTATNAGPNTAGTSDTLSVLGALAVGKSFNPSSIGTNDTSVMTITLTNANATAVSGAAFTDTYPAGLVNTSSANAASSCGGTLTGANGGTSLALSGATIPANGTCTITVNVTSAAAGTYVNSTGAVTTTNAGSAAAASASLAVLAHPTIAKSFAASQIAVNGTTTLTFTLSNTNATAISGVSFSDSYPAGLQNAATPNASTTCTGASITASGGGSGVSVSGATIPANGSCTVQVTVTPTSTGNLVNTLAAGALTSTNAGATTAPSSATLTSMSPLVVAKSFGASPVGANVPSTLTITLTNNNAVAITGVSFLDAYPAGLANTATPNAATTCAAGTVNASAAGTTLGFSGGTVAANGSCTITVNVSAAAPGSYTNTLAAGDVSTANAGPNGAPASATLGVLTSLTVTKGFNPPSIGTNDASVMTITLTNGNATAVTGVAFTDTYPANLVNTASAGAATTCGGTVTGANNGTSLALSGATVPANGSCTVTVNVTSATAGSYVNSTGTVTSASGGTAGPASGTLTVMAHPTVTKDFTPNQTGVNGTSTLVFTLGNTNAAAITGAAFTDNYPANLQNAATPSASSTCAGASITAAAGGTSIAVTGATIPANGSCTVQVNVTPGTTGSFVNTLAAGALTSTNAGASTALATATLSVQSPPTATKSFVPANIAVNGTSVLTITITNANPSGLTGVAFTDSYPAGLVNTGSPAAAIAGAGCSGTLAAAAGGASLALSGGVVPANSSCTITVNVTANTAGAYVNSTGAITTTNGGSAAAASGTLRVFLAPTVTKQFAPTFIPTGGSSTLTLTVTNPAANPANLTGVALSDTYPAGLTNNAAGSVSCTSGSATLSGGTNGGTSVGLTGATLPPGATCTITQSVTTTANVTNTTSTATSNEAAAGTAASASLATSNSPAIDKQFSPATVALGGTSTITFTLTNPNPIALTGAGFTDTLSGMQVDATGAAGGTCAGAGGNNFTAAQTSLAFTGLTVPASLSCTVTIVVRGTVVGAHNNTTSGLASNQAPTGPPSNTATLTVTATAPTVTKAFSASPINPGGTSTLTVTISNGNASSIAITSLTDTFPSGMSVAASPNITNSCTGGTVTNTSGSVTLTGGTVPGNASCAFSIDVTSSSAGAALVNTIPVGALTTNAGGNAVAASATLDVRPEADLSITKTAPATVASGGAITYTIVVSNAGPQAANGAQFSDNVPAAVTGVGASCGSPTGGAACGTVNIAGNAVTSTITTLPAGASVTFTITGTAPTSGTVTNAASVVTPAGVSDPTDPSRTGAGNNTASVNTTVTAPDLRVSKTHTGSFTVGTPGVYTITVDNALGTAATTGTITVTDTLPSGLTYSSAIGSGWTCSAAGQVVTCTSNAVIAAGATNPNAITLTVSVGSSAVGTVTNNVSVGGGGEPSVNNGNNAAFDATLVVAAASNSFQPDNAQTAMPGTTVYYAHVFNAGSAGSVSFSLSTVTTPATAGWTQQIYRDSDCNGTLSAAESASVLSGAIAMNAGDTVCIVIKDNIPSTAAYNATNQITVTATFTGGLTYARTDLTTVGAAGGAGLTLAKSVRNLTQGTASGTSNTARPNDVLEYTITYTNTSSGPLSAIVITDATPSFTTYQGATCGTPLPASLTGCTVTTAPAVGGTGSIVWTLGGSLISSGSGTVVFTVKVIP